MFKKYIIIFLVSMLPLVELRGAIPIAVGYGLPIVPSYIVSVIGNIVPVPFIFFFARKVLEWGENKKYIGKFCTWCITKGVKGSDKLKAQGSRASERLGNRPAEEPVSTQSESASTRQSAKDLGLYLALLLFVGIPLPGTGAWTGTLAASFLNMDFKKSVIAVTLGVILAGGIMLAASLGVFGTINLVK